MPSQRESKRYVGGFRRIIWTFMAVSFSACCLLLGTLNERMIHPDAAVTFYNSRENKVQPSREIIPSNYDHNNAVSSSYYLDPLVTTHNNPKQCHGDEFGFGPVLNQIVIASPPRRPRGPKILCVVNTHEMYHATRAQAVWDTWGPHCDKLVLASSQTDPALGAVRIPLTGYAYQDLWNKHRETLRYIYETYKDDEYEWFFKADDDTYVIVANLRELLGSADIQAQHERGVPLHIGSPLALSVDENGIYGSQGNLVDDKVLLARYMEAAGEKAGIFNDGGPGYAMNRAFLDRLIPWIDQNECIGPQNKSTFLDDVGLSLCSVLAFGGFPSSARDAFGRERFHTHNPATLYYTDDEYIVESWSTAKRFNGGFQVGEDCCSSKSISFHQMGPDEMRSAHNLLFTCRERGVDGIRNILPQPRVGTPCISDPLGFAPVLDKIEVAPDRPGPKILCFVNTHEMYHETRAQAVLDTWGPKCDKLVFASSKTDTSLGAVRINNTGYEYGDLWNKHRETLRFLYETYKDEYEWFFKADDDTLTIVENLKEYLETPDIRDQHNRGIPLHIGNSNIFVPHKLGGVYDGQGRNFLDMDLYSNFMKLTNNTYRFNVGGAGYVMNLAFLERFMEWIDRRECSSDRSISTQLDDPMISFCSAHFGVFPYNTTREESGRERFHQFTPSDLYNFRPTDQDYSDVNYLKRFVGGFKVGEECCSTKSITFHHMEPYAMHAAYDMLYKCREKRNRTLVILWGNIRGGDPSWNSLYNHLLDINDADLALAVGAQGNQTSSLYERARYVWEFVEHDSWSKAIDDMFGTSPDDEPSWRYIAKQNYNGPFGATEEDPVSSGAIRGLLTMFVAENLQQLGLVHAYDRFVLTRSDQFYTVDLPLDQLDPTKIWVPMGEDWSGICDRFFACGRNHILTALNTHSPVILNPRKYYDFKGNIEMFIKRRWEEEGIFQHVRRFQRPMFTASIDSDQTRWSVGKQAFVEGGIQINYKYIDEYYQAMSTRRNQEIVEVAKAMQGRSGKPFLIVLQASIGMVPLVKSWLCNTATMKDVHENTLIILDERAYQQMNEFSTNATIVLDALAPPLQRSWKYGTQGFWRTVLHRMNVVGELIDAGVDLLLAEADATWIQSVYEDSDVVQATEHVLFTYTTNDTATEGNMTLGVSRFRATEEVKGLWQTVRARFLALQGGPLLLDNEDLVETVAAMNRTSDQLLFAAEIDKRVRAGMLTARFLSPCKYPGVRWYEDKGQDGKYHRNDPNCRGTLPVVIQNNGGLDHEQRVKRAKQWGHWFIDADTGLCPEGNKAHELLKQARRTVSAGMP